MVRSLIVLMCVMIPAAAFASGDTLYVSGHYSVDNLTLFLIAGESRLPNTYLTLEEALRSGKAVIHENNSQRLWIENRSDSDLYIQSGDLITGGQQDRMIANDMIISPHDTSRDLQVYCVERLRSTKRGEEPIETFSASREIAPLPHMRVTARHELTKQLLTPHVGGLTAPDEEQLKLLESIGSLPQQVSVAEDAVQESIWKDVEQVQSGLTRVVHDSVTRNISPSSLNLALGSSAVAKIRANAEDEFTGLIDSNKTAVGVVYAINGVLRGGDIYGSHAMLRKMWSKLVRSYVTESKVAPEAKKATLTDNDIRQFLYLSVKKRSQSLINPRTQIAAGDRGSDYVFDCEDMRYPSIAVHRSYVVK